FTMDNLIDNNAQQQQSTFNINDLDFIMSLQDQHHQLQQAQPPQQQSMQSGQQIMLEQQFKLAQLQQLQQLQNQIFQQQIALISGTNPSGSLPAMQDQQRHSPGPYRGLPTPGSSTELRASQPVEYVSPMLLDYPASTRGAGYHSAPAH